MTGKELKQFAATVPDEAIVLTPGSDHCYDKVHVCMGSVMVYANGFGKPYYCEDHGDTCNEPGGKRIPGVIIAV